MSTIRNSDEFRQAIWEYESDLRERTGQPLYRPFVAAREELATAVDGLDLTTHEWRHLEFRLNDDGDMVELLASIITKARQTARADLSAASATL